MRARLIDLGCVVIGGTAEYYGQHIREAIAKWQRVVKQAGIKLD